MEDNKLSYQLERQSTILNDGDDLPTQNLHNSLVSPNRQITFSLKDNTFPMLVTGVQDASVILIVNRDEQGYGMKVSGDNPVYIQSVKSGGAAEKAGLHPGDRIVKVNGLDVTKSTHTEVVGLIRASSQVSLTVQQRSHKAPHTSPSTRTSLHNRSGITSLTMTQITEPQPVDHVKQCQLQHEREQHYMLMIEKQQRYIDLLHSQLATSPDEKTHLELMKADQNLNTLQDLLVRTKNEFQSVLSTACDQVINDVQSLRETSTPVDNESDSKSCCVSPKSPPTRTPPGTPPPPYLNSGFSYLCAFDEQEFRKSDDTLDTSNESVLCNLSGESKILKQSSQTHKCSAPSDADRIHAAHTQKAQQLIISMEDDEIWDQDVNPFEDHGYFKSLSRLWDRLPHLAVFMNYVLSNSDPNSLFFYLITDLYKEGNAKEMRKWAFEIHSCFLVPGAPLRLSNVCESIACEIDNVLLCEHDKEEILRKVFWKARCRAKEELTRQLADFQQKRTAGLGTIFGPTDQMLNEMYNDKSKEAKLYENLFVERLDPCLDELETNVTCSQFDPKQYYTNVALLTVLSRIFNVRFSSHSIEKYQTFVNKERSFRTKLMAVGKHTRKLTIQGHHFVAQTYLTVLPCNNCQQIIYGIAPQGYQCLVCLINLHWSCIKLYDDVCPGPISKKDRGLGKFMRIRQHESNEYRRKPYGCNVTAGDMEDLGHSDNHEFSNTLDKAENGHKQAASTPNDKPLVPKETLHRLGGCGHDSVGMSQIQGKIDSISDGDKPNSNNVTKRTISNINRSESVKEQSEKRKQRRNISDPSHNNTSGILDLDSCSTILNADSGSSSNSNISFNDQLSESPTCYTTESTCVSSGISTDTRNISDWESDVDTEPINWQVLFPHEKLRELPAYQKKRQDVINELLQTERSHVRNLRVLYEIFYKTLSECGLLKADELALIFPNIKEILNVHISINNEMKRHRMCDPLFKGLGNLLVDLFSGSKGEGLQRAAAIFCERQQVALEFIKERRKRDSRFDQTLLDCEKRRQCRRLPFQGILPTEMQRLSKYPLLLDRLICSIEVDIDSRDLHECANFSVYLDEDELQKLRAASQSCKEILNYVNEAAKVAFHRERLESIQKHMDTSSFDRSDHPIALEFRTIDLTKYKLLSEGVLRLRRPGKAISPVHILLLEEAVVLLHKEGDRFLLKFFQSGSPAQTQPLSPIIKMSTLLVRNNAVCKKSLFLVSTSTNNSQMYDLVAKDDATRESWYKQFTDASEAYNQKIGKTKKMLESVQLFTNNESSSSQFLTRELNSEPSIIEPNTKSDLDDEDSKAIKDTEVINATYCEDLTHSRVIPTVETEVSNKTSSMIQSSEVHVWSTPSYFAETTLSPFERIRRKDALIKKTLAEKEKIIADLVRIPEGHFKDIADILSESNHNSVKGGSHVLQRSDSVKCLFDDESQDSVELALAAIYQIDQLQSTINDALSVNEDVIITAGDSSNTIVCQNHTYENINHITQHSVLYTARVRNIANVLSSQLTTIFSQIKRINEERESLRKELFMLRERLHEVTALHPTTYTNADDEIEQFNRISLLNASENENKEEDHKRSQHSEE